MLLNNHFGEYDKAREHHEKAIELDSSFARAHDNLGVLLNNHFGEYDKAREHHEKAIELDPSYALAHDNLGVLLLEQFDQPLKALTCHRLAIQHDPCCSSAWNNLGVAQIRSFRLFAEGTAALLEATRADPVFALPWKNLGFVFSDTVIEPVPPMTASRCFNRFFLLSDIRPVRSAWIIDALRKTNLPLRAMRWILEHASDLSILRHARNLSALSRDCLPIASYWSTYADNLEGASGRVDRIYLQHLLGDPVRAYREACDCWLAEPSSPSWAALASFLAMEVLETGVVAQVEEQALPACVALATGAAAPPFHLFSAAMILRQVGRTEEALTCARRCRDTEFAYPSLWLEWHLLTESGHTSANDLASEIISEEQRRCDQGSLTLTIPLGVEHIQGDWTEARIIVRHLMLQEHLEDAVSDFITLHESRLSAQTTVSRWKKWRDYKGHLLDFAAAEVVAYKQEPQVSNLLALITGSSGQVLIRELAGLAETLPLRTPSDLDPWVKVIRCHLNDSRLTAEDPLLGCFVAFLVVRQVRESRRGTKRTALSALPNLVMGLLGLGEELVVLVNAFLPWWQHHLDLHSTNLDFESFQTEIAALLDDPDFDARLIGQFERGSDSKVFHGQS